MSRHIDKEALVAAVMSSTELDNEQKSQLIRLIREQKKYSLVWEDSTEDAWEKMKTSIPILKEVDGKRILNDKDGEHYPNHAIIEADNLHALIALTYTHAGMIDVIYIDPPYNTGNKDFVYNDSFIGEDDAYRHSKWLSFMEKRLQIAKTLLSEKGVIFISIDDNEQANLKLLCDEVFGCANFITSIPRKGTGGRQDSKYYAVIHEYILVYANRLEQFEAGRQMKDIDYKHFDKQKHKRYNTQLLRKWGDNSRREDRPNLFYPIYYNQQLSSFSVYRGNDTDVEIFPMLDDKKEGCWRWGKDTMQDGFDNGLVEIQKNRRGDLIPYERVYETGGVKSKPYNTWIDDIDNSTGSTLLKEILGNNTFSYPKPTDLICRIIKMASSEKAITILDFFAGSGTTLHATMQLNAEDGGHRQCILVTNNENNICEEVTYERNKRVIEGYTTPKGEQVAGLSHNNLRYYKLDFNPRKQSHQDNRELFYGLKDLLCIKENIYHEELQFGSLSLEGKEQMLRYFAENGREMLMVYDTKVIPFIVSEIAQRGEQEQPLKIYIFADGAYPYADDFASVIEKVSLVPMPYAYYRGIKDSLPEETTTKVDDTELTNEEQQAMMAEAIEAEKAERKEDTSND